MSTHSLPTAEHRPALDMVEEQARGKPRVRSRLGWAFWLPTIWLAVVLVAALGASWLPIHDPLAMDFLYQAGAPNGQYLFGTDDLGRDMFARVIHGARISLSVGFFAPLIALLIGTTLGVTAGYFRGRWELAVVMYADVSLAFPGIILLLLLVTYFGSGLLNLMVALGILLVPAYVRVARANTLTFAQRDFVTAARALGASHARILWREILPNVLLPVLAFSFIIVATVIVLEGVLSFLGLGVPHPTPSWGSMISDGRELLGEAPHVSFIPASVMFLTVLSFNMLGDSLRKALDTRESRV
ncbi:MAG: ABC transporter permease [SAR324 cluster bacterium]|nr:ABC transporter permease [SAR324 cluster bacterium]